MRALLRWTLDTWVTLAKAPAWVAAPRLTLVGTVPRAEGTAAGSATLLQEEVDSCQLACAEA